MIEAMACGTPVLAFRCGSVPEIVEDRITGAIVETMEEAIAALPGMDDQLGSLNLITPASVRAAITEVKQGLSFCLSLPLDYPGGRSLAPHRFPPVLHSTQRNGKRFFNYSFRNEGKGWSDVGCDDYVTLSTQYSTQWDSFAHIGSEFDIDGDGKDELCFYNGYVAGEHIRPPEDRAENPAMPLGIEAFAARPIQGRGVMLDLDHHFGRDRREVTMKDIAHVLEADRVTIETGDILCLHTGFAAELLRMNRTPDPNRIHDMCCALDGRDEDLLDWISRSGIAAIAADNFAVERVRPYGRQQAPGFRTAALSLPIQARHPAGRALASD